MPGQSGPLSALAARPQPLAPRRAPSSPTRPCRPPSRFRDQLARRGRDGHRRGPAGAAPGRGARRSPSHDVGAAVARSSAGCSRPPTTSPPSCCSRSSAAPCRADGSSAGGVAAARQVLGAARRPRRRRLPTAPGCRALDRQTPAGQVALLRAGRRSPVAASFRAALPVGCVDGTLQKRLCGTAAAGRVQAKTGTLLGRPHARRLHDDRARPAASRFAFQLSGVATAPGPCARSTARSSCWPPTAADRRS